MNIAAAPSSSPWWEKPLHALDRGEWEALCDGCGRCCLHKLEDEETGELHPTNVACKLLDRRAGMCSDYANRKRHVPDCVQLTKGKMEALEWLPSTCAYKLRRDGQPLPEWHYLVTGDRESVHRAKQSTRGWTVSEVDAGDFEWHVVDREL